MQIIFEPNDLVMRQVMMRTELTEDGFKGDVIATVVGRKHEDKDRYLDCAFLTQSGGKWHGRRYADIVVDRNLFQLPDGPAKGDIAIGDEMMLTGPMADLYVRFSKIHAVFKPEDGVPLEICSDGTLLQRRVEKEAGMKYTKEEFSRDNIVKLSVGTNGHQWSTASGHGTFVDVTVKDLACTRWELQTTNDSEGLKSLRLLLDGDAEYDNLVDVCEAIACYLKKMRNG